MSNDQTASNGFAFLTGHLWSTIKYDNKLDAVSRKRLLEALIEVHHRFPISISERYLAEFNEFMETLSSNNS